MTRSRCTDACGASFDTKLELLHHITTCPTILTGVQQAAARELQRLGSRKKKPAAPAPPVMRKVLPDLFEPYDTKA
jgi:ribosomal protein L34E